MNTRTIFALLASAASIVLALGACSQQSSPIDACMQRAEPYEGTDEWMKTINECLGERQ